VSREALSPDDYINVLLLLFPTNSHQPNPTNLRLCIGLCLCMRRQKSPFYCFLLPKHFYSPPNFFYEAYCFHLSLEWMRRRLSTVGGNAENVRKTTKQVTQLCVFALCRNITEHYKGIEYKKDDGPWKVYVSDKSDNSSNNQPQIAQQNSLTEDDNDCAMSNLQIGWIDPNFDVKIDASNSEAENTHLDSGNPNESQMTQHCL